jgi:hypothetical protein
MKKSLEQKVAEKIDKVTQYNDYCKDIFDEYSDPEILELKEYYLRIAKEIIIMVKKEIEK